MPASTETLARYLPIRFPNGTQIRHFAKHCQQCDRPVDAEHMNGEVCLVEDRVLVVAQAVCPHCMAAFNIRCMILSDKQVRRVRWPMWLLRWYLRTMQADGKVLAPVATAPEPVLPEGVRQSALGACGEVIGQFSGQSIYAWVEVEGKTYDYEAIAPKGVANLLAGDILVSGCLVYRARVFV